MSDDENTKENGKLNKQLLDLRKFSNILSKNMSSTTGKVNQLEADVGQSWL